MSFGINKCVTMVIKRHNFVQSHSFEGLTFHLGKYSFPKIFMLYLSRNPIQ